MELIAQDYGLMFIFPVDHYFVLLIQIYIQLVAK